MMSVGADVASAVRFGGGYGDVRVSQMTMASSGLHRLTDALSGLFVSVLWFVAELWRSQT